VKKARPALLARSLRYLPARAFFSAVSFSRGSRCAVSVRLSSAKIKAGGITRMPTRGGDRVDPFADTERGSGHRRCWRRRSSRSPRSLY
jgi:hypothetical protein